MEVRHPSHPCGMFLIYILYIYNQASVCMHVRNYVNPRRLAFTYDTRNYQKRLFFEFVMTVLVIA